MPAPGGGPGRIDRVVALFLLGAIAFNPPLLRVFGAGETVFGWPLLHVYILGVWAAVIVLLALHLERG
ncbi:hypothetical protein [Azospirillum halopraeferens]|uniref:hypothetical protein n=1 Tax=Azospirillum halopraeferens TaxID=34010 RepID=UPI0004278861|nr:hypothetical protein [Azospirillum halopraeferens]